MPLLKLQTNMGALTLEDHHRTAVLESELGYYETSRDAIVRHSLTFGDVEQLHAALGTWLERQRPAHQLPHVRR